MYFHYQRVACLTETSSFREMLLDQAIGFSLVPRFNG